MGTTTVDPERQSRPTFVEIPRGPRTAMPHQGALEKAGLEPPLASPRPILWGLAHQAKHHL